jgi:hypothetical protein
MKDSFKLITPFDVILLSFVILNNLQPKSIFSIVLFSSNISFRTSHPSSFKKLSNFIFYNYLH